MFGGEVGVFGGEASLPPPPTLDRTLISEVSRPIPSCGETALVSTVPACAKYPTISGVSDIYANF